jgi:hypothetical protein
MEEAAAEEINAGGWLRWVATAASEWSTGDPAVSN